MSRTARSRGGMVVAAHPIAAKAGASILRRGGGAAEAAVATSLTLGVVEPFASGLGGGGYFLVAPGGEEDRTEILDGRGTVSSLLGGDRTYPSGASVPMMPRVGPLAAAVPGLGRTLALLLKRHGGKVPLEELCAPAIRAAEKGFRISETYVRCQKLFEGAVRATPECARAFLRNGKLRRPGERLVLKPLARTLRRIAKEGFEVLYTGEIGRRMLDCVNRTGPVWARKDLTGYRVKIREPLRGEVEGHTILTMPPPSRGGAGILRALSALAAREARSLESHGAEYILHLARSIRETFQYLRPRIADPDHVEISSPDLAPSPSTTHFTIVDAKGTVISASQTIGHFFGSGLMVSGILLNDDLADCDGHPDRPNSVHPGRRTVSNMAPTVVFRGDRPRWALGTPGSLRIFPALTQVLANVLLHGQTLEEAVASGRIHWEDGTLHLEGHIPGKVRALVRERSDEPVVERGRNDLFFGGVNAVEIGTDGVRTGVADPRRDGAAVGM